MTTRAENRITAAIAVFVLVAVGILVWALTIIVNPDVLEGPPDWTPVPAGHDVPHAPVMGA